jgi:DNA repair protein RadC
MTSELSLTTLPSSERPRERCLAQGGGCLSLRECLAVILGSGPPSLGCMGLARRILELPGDGLGEKESERAFFTLLEDECGAPLSLRRVHGLGDAGRARIIGAFELGRRYSAFRQVRERNRAPVPIDSELRFRALSAIDPSSRLDPREWLAFIPVHRSGAVGELCRVGRGARTHVHVDPAELFARVLAVRPRGFFLLHNHPSGDLQASLDDQELTRKVGQVSRMLGVALLGHWIVCPDGEHFLAPTA